MAYFLHGPNSLVTSIVAIALGFFFPLLVNAFGITSTAQLKQASMKPPDEPILELPSDLEDSSTTSSAQGKPEASFITGMENYLLGWAIITFGLILILPLIIK